MEEAAAGTCRRSIQQGQESGNRAGCQRTSRKNRATVDGERFFIQRARSHRRCERQAMIDKEEKLPVTRQCTILDINRSSVYYKPVPLSERDRELMRQIDEIHLNYPFYGSRNIRNELWSRGYAVSRDRVRRLMRRMGIEALYIKPKLSWRNPQHTRYPYLLRNIEITRANHVWCADITYIPMAGDFVIWLPSWTGPVAWFYPGNSPIRWTVLCGGTGRSHHQIRLP